MFGTLFGNLSRGRGTRARVAWQRLVSIVATAIIVVTASVVGITVSVARDAQAADQIVLKAVTFLPVKREKMQIKGVKLIDRINEVAAKKYPGELKINLLGGPEVIKSGQQPIAVRTGTIDLCMTCASFYQGLVPVGDILLLSQVSLAEERSGGALAYIRELHEKAGLFALGRMDGTRAPFFYVATRKPMTGAGDLSGLRAGSVSLFAEAFSRALGMSFKVIPYGDSYPAMERGVIDVYVNALDTQSALGLSKLKGYTVVDHPIYVDNCMAIMNLDKWRSIPKHLQKLMLDVQEEMETVAGKQMTEFNAGQRQKMIDAGVKFLRFSAADAKRFTDMAYSAQWAKMLKLQPEIAGKLKSMLSK